MLKVRKDSTVMIEFGASDICITGGDSSQSEYGLVTLTNQKPRPIGTPGIHGAGSDVSPKNVDVWITFTNKESIDVLIHELEEAKRWMD
jgi:hypothetical protein